MRHVRLVSMAMPPHKTASVSDLTLHQKFALLSNVDKIEAIVIVALHTRHKSRVKISFIIPLSFVFRM